MPKPLDTRIQTIPSNHTDDIEPETLKEEVATALKHLKEGKAAGFDRISAEEMKATGETGVNVIHKLCRTIWETENNTGWLGKGSHCSHIQKEVLTRLCKLQRNQPVWLERSSVVLFIHAWRRKPKRYSLNPKQVLDQVEAQLTNFSHSSGK